MTDRHEKKFRPQKRPNETTKAAMRDCRAGRVKSFENLDKLFEEIRPHTPVYKPDDPRIQQDLRRGAGVGVDLSGLTKAQQERWWADREAEIRSAGIRAPVRDVIREANERMLPDNERFSQEEDEDDSRSENT